MASILLEGDPTDVPTASTSGTVVKVFAGCAALRCCQTNSGSGEDIVPIQTVCCPDNPVPSILRLTCIGGDYLEGTYDLIYNGEDATAFTWASLPVPAVCTLGSHNLVFVFQCLKSFNFWRLLINTDDQAGFSALSAQCNPFEVMFAGSNIGFSFCPYGLFSIIVDEG